MDNEAVLKALFTLKNDELTFTKAIDMAQETEEAVRVAKETVYGQTSKPVHKVGQPKSKANTPRASTHKAKGTPQGKLDQSLSKGSCGRSGKKNHASKDCPCTNDVCHCCQKKRHLQSVCMSKIKQHTGVRYLRQLDMVKTVRTSIPPLYQQVKLRGHRVNFEIDSGANDTMYIKDTWIKAGKPNFSQWRLSIKLQMGTHCKYWDSSESLLNWIAKLEAYI